MLLATLALSWAQVLVGQSPSESPPVGGGTAVVEPAPPAAQREPMTRFRRAGCVAAAVAVGSMVTFPAIVPLWLAGAAKGLTLGAAALDLKTRMHIGKPLPKGREHTDPSTIPFMMGMAMGAGLFNTALNLPGFMITITTALLMVIFTTDGLHTGACSEKPLGRPHATRAPSLPLMGFMALVALLPLPLIIAPNVLGAVAILIALGWYPAMPVPGFGFMDIQQAFKRAGLAQSAAWPLLHVSAAMSGLVALQALFGFWGFLEADGGRVE